MKVLAVIVAGGLCSACGGDGRAPTAPPLPQPVLDSPCSEYDIGADGTVDIVYQFTYDADGFMTRFDGTPGPDIGEFTYDANHFLIHSTQQYDADPEPEHEETYTRDPDGRILTYALVDAGNTTSGTYTYDADGRTTDVMITTPAGQYQYSYTYAGDDLNPTTGRLVYPGGTSAFAYTSSDDERVVHVDIDDQENGSVDRSSDTKYDDERRVVEQINGSQGMVVSRTARMYSARGNLISEVYADHDGGQDDYVFTSVLDGRGLQTERGLASPSGQYANDVYREVDKAQCGTAR